MIRNIDLIQINKIWDMGCGACLKIILPIRIRHSRVRPSGAAEEEKRESSFFKRFWVPITIMALRVVEWVIPIINLSNVRQQAYAKQLI